MKMLSTLFALATIVPLASPALTADVSEPSFPDYDQLTSESLRIRLLPGTDSFTFSIYGCPTGLDDIKALVATMKRE